MKKSTAPLNFLSVVMWVLAAASTSALADGLPAKSAQPSSACKGTYTIVSHSDGRFTGKGVMVSAADSGGNPATMVLSTRSAAFTLIVPETLKDYAEGLANQCAVVTGIYSEVDGHPHVTVKTIEARPN